MSGRLAGKSALITGAGQGMGAAAARAFAREGAQVWATSRSAGPLEALAGAPGIDIRVLDVTEPAAIADAAAAIGAVDVLVNNAGLVAHGSVLEVDEDDLDRSIDVNIKGAFRMIRAFLPGMLEKGAGAIVNVASVLSSVTAVPNRFPYVTTKAAMIGMTKQIAAEYAGRGIRCNALCPGVIDTPTMRERMAAAAGDYETGRKAFTARHPVGRIGNEAEMGEAILFLASDDSGFMTGQTLVMDGGMTI